MVMRRCLAAVWCAAMLGVGSPVFAADIDGVQPAAIDQPRINMIVRTKPGGAPLSGSSLLGGETSRVEAYLDTGASGILISANTAELLGITREQVGKPPSEARFEDVGVGGSDDFAISQPLFLSFAPYDSDLDLDDGKTASTFYSQTIGPLHTQIGPLEGMANALLAMIAGDLDVAGMPAMEGKIVVLNVNAVNSFSDTMQTFIYDGNTPVAGNSPSQGIPRTRWHVRVSDVSFAPFTRTTPAGATPPLMAPDPMIGPNPLPGAPAVANPAPPITASMNGKTTQATWLLDTGAATSMISLDQAARLGIRYVADTLDTDHPKLENIPANQQFTMTVGGIGGSKKSAGLYLDSLTLQTKEGEKIVFRHAPVLVADITVEDPVSHHPFTLPGVFGMNYLTATAKLSEDSLIPDIDNLTAGGFKYLVYDQPHALLGLEPTDIVAQSR